MKILSLNSGSSSVKFQLYDMPEGKVLIAANFERIGIDGSFYNIKINGEKIRKEVVLETHEDAIKIFLNELLEYKIIDTLDEIKGVGHRVVHGGSKYSKSVVVTDEVINDVYDLKALAPLQNPAEALGMRIVKELLPNSINVAVFDTAFHQTIPEEAYIYAVPYEWYEKYGIRKYGFHGTSHKYLSQRVSEILGRKDLKIITCHIGSGSSISAIKNGVCIDTSMGFTPVAGITMGTRCGDIDPSIIEYVMEKSGMNISEIMTELNKNSGLLGISGISSDGRDIEDAVHNNIKRGVLANNIFIRKIAFFIAQYNLLLNGADVIIFSAGIGENSKEFRRSVGSMLESLGVKIDEEKNDIRGKEALISNEDSKILCYAIPTDEELMISKETFELIEG